MHARVYDHAGLDGRSRLRTRSVLPSALLTASAPGITLFRGSMAGLHALPYRRFADTLADACARLGADVVRYTFIVVDFHHLLLAGLPAHPK